MSQDSFFVMLSASLSMPRQQSRSMSPESSKRATGRWDDGGFQGILTLLAFLLRSSVTPCRAELSMGPL